VIISEINLHALPHFGAARTKPGQPTRFLLISNSNINKWRWLNVNSANICASFYC